MSEKVELKLERVKLIQSGKFDEAQRVLEKYWNLCGKSKKELVITENKTISKPEEKVLEETIKVDIKKSKKTSNKKKDKFLNINDLSRIKGIGKETIEDIKSIYTNLDELINDLKCNKRIPLRNDLSKKLKFTLMENGKE